MRSRATGAPGGRGKGSARRGCVKDICGAAQSQSQEREDAFSPAGRSQFRLSCACVQSLRHYSQLLLDPFTNDADFK